MRSNEGLAPGICVGHFEIVRPIGEGAMGAVYQAVDTMLDRPVALKVLPAHLFRDDSFVKRFQREARAVAKLEHANVVRIYEFGQQADVHFIAMELLEGGSVGDQLAGGYIFPETEAVAIIRGAARGLGAAHAAGIIHRDVKPDNLMRAKTGEVKIVDLGIARLEKEARVDQDEPSLTQAGSPMGTPHYVAPEQILNASGITGQADIYSLGATLYHMVTGKTPFEGATGTIVMMGHLMRDLPDPQQISPALSNDFCALLRKMMARDVGDRFPDMASVDQALRDLTVAAPPSLKLVIPRLKMADISELPKEPPCSEDQMRLLEKELARFIGPLAKMLVKRSAAECNNFEELAGRLAHQIPDPNQQKAFLKGVKAL